MPNRRTATWPESRPNSDKCFFNVASLEVLSRHFVSFQRASLICRQTFLSNDKVLSKPWSSRSSLLDSKPPQPSQLGACETAKFNKIWNECLAAAQFATAPQKLKQSLVVNSFTVSVCTVVFVLLVNVACSENATSF